MSTLLKEDFESLTSFFGMLFNILLNYFLISKNGAIGASLASFCTQFITALIQIFLCFKIFELHNLKYLIEPILVFTIGIILIGFLTVSYSQLWHINICIFGFLSIIWSFVSGMVRFRYISYIFNND